MFASRFLFDSILLPVKAEPRTDEILTSGVPSPLDDEDGNGGNHVPRRQSIIGNRVNHGLNFKMTNLRACLHGGGGPQVCKVTRLAVVEK